MMTSNFLTRIFQMPSQSLAATADSRGGNIHGFCHRKAYSPNTWLAWLMRSNLRLNTGVKTLARRIRQEYSKRLGFDAVLLCWDAPGKFGHRRLVASWLEEGVRHMVLKYKPSQKL